MIDVYLSRPGVICCAGSDIRKLWLSVTEGDQSGLKRVKVLNGKEFWAGKVDDILLSEKSAARYDMRLTRLEENALSQIEDVIFSAKEKYGSERIGVCVGSCDNGSELSLESHKTFFSTGKFDDDYSLEMQGADYVSTFISEKYGLKGPSLAFETACSSSASAIIKAAELIRAGFCDAVVAGGVDVASDIVLMGFDSLEAVSSEKTNPFSKNRHGITIGEGAAFFVLSKDSLDGEKIRLLGYGESADAYHMTSPDPSGEGAFRAMKKALESSGLHPEDIDYLNLHGTGTKFNDSMEAKAVSALFGGYRVPCSTTKPLTGHTLGAAGAIEAAICWAGIKNPSLGNPLFPVQVWDGIFDEEMPPLNIATKGSPADVKKIDICMSNSFAFGGANASLVIGL